MKEIINQIAGDYTPDDPECQKVMKTLIDNIQEEIESNLDWVTDQNSVAMCTILVGLSLNEVMEATFGEDGYVAIEDLDKVYPVVIHAWLQEIREKLGMTE